MTEKPFADRTEREQVAALRSLVAAKFHGEGRTLASCKKIAHQHNTTFVAVEKGGTPWFIRLSRSSARTLEQVESEVAWMRELDAAGFPVAGPEPWADGSTIATLEAPWLPETRIAVRFKWSAGTVAKNPTAEQWHTIGSLLARLHSHTEGRTDLGHGRWEVDGLVGNSGTEQDAISNARTCLGDDAAEILAKVGDAYRQLRPKLGPVQLLHGDLHEYNVLWQDAQPTVVDFDDCGWAPPVYDLAVKILDFRDDEDAASEAALLAGYASVRPLPAGLEDIQTPLDVRRAQLVYWILSERNTPGFFPNWKPYTRKEIAKLSR